MKQQERKMLILEELKEKGELNIKEASDKFDVTTPVIRQDIDELANLFPEINRIYGKASWVGSELNLDVFRSKVKNNFEEKSRIAKHMARSVEDGDVIVIFPGTIPYLCTEELINLQKRSLSIFTCSLPAIVALSDYPYVKTICQGGMLDSGHLYFHQNGVLDDDKNRFKESIKSTLLQSGIQVEGKDILFDKALASTKSIDLKNLAIKDSEVNGSEEKQRIFELSREIIIGVDHSRLTEGRQREVGYQDVKSYAEDSNKKFTIVTDDRIPDHSLEVAKETLKEINLKSFHMTIADRSGKVDSQL